MTKDLIFPSESSYGIPILDLTNQATELTLPFRGWGQLARRKKFTGTWHFYTYDYKFTALWNRPENLLQTACVAAVEPNYSTNDQMPKALVLADIYRKRWLARYWQSRGVKILVDLNVCDAFLDVAFLGVPQGWRSFAIRAADYQIDQLERRANIASSISNRQSTLTMIVYSGGPKVRALCQERGWIFIADQTRQPWEAKVEAEVDKGVDAQVEAPAAQAAP